MALMYTHFVSLLTDETQKDFWYFGPVRSAPQVAPSDIRNLSHTICALLRYRTTNAHRAEKRIQTGPMEKRRKEHKA